VTEMPSGALELQRWGSFSLEELSRITRSTIPDALGPVVGYQPAG